MHSVLEYHRGARATLPNERLHASIHVVVENQVALGDALPARQVLERLQAEGLDRHDAIHAIGAVLADHIDELMKHRASADPSHEGYWAELRALTADRWRRRR